MRWEERTKLYGTRTGVVLSFSSVGRSGGDSDKSHDSDGRQMMSIQPNSQVFLTSYHTCIALR